MLIKIIITKYNLFEYLIIIDKIAIFFSILFSRIITLKTCVYKEKLNKQILLQNRCKYKFYVVVKWWQHWIFKDGFSHSIINFVMRLSQVICAFELVLTSYAERLIYFMKHILNISVRMEQPILKVVFMGLPNN